MPGCGILSQTRIPNIGWRVCAPPAAATPAAAAAVAAAAVAVAATAGATI